MKICSSFTFIFLIIVISSLNILGDVKLPDVLANSMVLQQNQKVPIWGTADVGETVIISFQKQKFTTIADQKGKWRIDLKPLKANSKPENLIIQANNKIELKDILIGEVWLVSGQSNMQWTLYQSNNGEAEVAKANHPNIRLFNVSREVAFKKKQGKLGEWKDCNPKTVKEFSGAGYYFGVELQKNLNVPIGLINSSYGGSQAEAWTPVEYLKDNPDLVATVERTKIWDEERPRVKVEYAAAIEKWKVESEKQKASGVRPSPSPAVPDALRDYRIAASIYDGMIAPLIPFAIKGAIWYQGESNEARAEQYNILLPTMIRSWREKWRQENFSFGIIQLPNYRQPRTEPVNEAWSFIRDAQRRTSLNTPNTGLIVTIDIGEANDIHPKNKLDVGLRMSRWALKTAYKKKLINSPVMINYVIKGNKIELTFDEVGTGLKLTKGEKLEEFAIAGIDQKFIWADAKIVGRNKILVWSDKIMTPKAVRYAFNNNPRNPNLTNDSGLPASPFRTDNWDDPTKGKR